MHAPRVPPRKASVGDERDLVAQAHAHDGAGGAEHFLHARAAPRAFVADHHHIPGLDLARQDACHGFILRFEDARRAAELAHRWPLTPPALTTAPLGARLPNRMASPPLAGMGILIAADDFLILDLGAVDRFPQRLAR